MLYSHFIKCHSCCAPSCKGKRYLAASRLLTYTRDVQGREDVGVRELLGCFNAADKSSGIKIKVADHSS